MSSPSIPRRALVRSFFHAPRPGATFALAVLALCALSGLARSESVRVVRDDWGVPHVFGDTDEGVSFGLGYAQAEDRLEEMLKNYRRAVGTMTEIEGEGAFRDDYIARAARNAEVSAARYGEVSEPARRSIEAFVAGVKKYIAEHPEAVPEWGRDQAVEPWHVLALSRLVIMGWPLSDGIEEMMKSGVFVNQLPYRGSNQWVVSGARTEAGVPIALIDPHLSWYDVFRFYECRLYGATIKVSGVCILGTNLPTLGHNEYLSVAMTTGSGDTADTFEETLNPDNPLQYQVDGAWVDMEVKTEIFRIKKDDGTFEEREQKIPFTRHGPIVATRGGKGYALAVPYMESVGLPDQAREMMTSKNVAEMKAALSRLELMGQNVMIATVDGDTYYQRTGKVPIRAPGIDPTRAIDGSKTANDWQGIHPAEDLVQIENPKQGYMQNCNCSPFYMMKDSPLRAAKYLPYIYGTDEHLTHQRANMVLDHLASDDKITLEDAFEIASSCEIYGAQGWQSRLGLAAIRRLTRGAGPVSDDPQVLADFGTMFSLISEWNRRSDADSKGAMAFKYFKEEIHKAMTKEELAGEEKGAPPPTTLNDKEVIGALVEAAKRMRAERGSVEVAYGDVHRVGRKGGDRTYPVGGGQPMKGMGTPRAIGFDKRDDGTLVGRSGQTSVQIVMLTRPPRSWTVLPLGQSDHKDSGHWDDQAEKLFSKGKLKSTYYMDPAALEAAKTSEITLEFGGN